MQFTAEIVEVKSKKTASLDLEYSVKLRTNDPAVLSLGAISPDTTVKIEVTPENG